MSFRSLGKRHEVLPWSWPRRHGMGVAVMRQRAIITATDCEGFGHEAELGPCPGVHQETLNEALDQWDQRIVPHLRTQVLPLHYWSWTKPYFGLLEPGEGLASSVQTAAEQLLLSWAFRQNPGEFSLPAPMNLPGSALLALTSDVDASWQEFLCLWRQGFRLYKCKLGRHDPDFELAFLQRMYEYGCGALQLRLDANQAMSEATRFFWLAYSGSLPIQFWEEAGDEPEALRPRAIDESLWDCGDDPPKSDVWILKPTRITLSRFIRLLQLAARDGIPCILSNAFDSGLSLRCSAWLYAVFCKNPEALGFGTVRFLPADIWQSQAFGAPLVTIPRHPFPLSGGTDACGPL